MSNVTTSKEQETVEIYGKEYNVLGYVSSDIRNLGETVAKDTPGAVPLIDFKMMSDFKWQYNCLMSRLAHPEHYAELDTDVSAAIERLKQWLREHIDGISELKPNEQEDLMRILKESKAA